MILLQVGATSMSVLRSVWQTYWLHENWDNSDNVFHQLAQSILQMEDRFEDFIEQLNRAGWDMHQINLRIPKDITIDDSGPVWLFRYQWSVFLVEGGWSWASLCSHNVGYHSLSQNWHADAMHHTTLSSSLHPFYPKINGMAMGAIRLEKTLWLEWLAAMLCGSVLGGVIQMNSRFC